MSTDNGDFNTDSQDAHHTTNISKEVDYSLVAHVYNQSFTALLASLFCASIVFISIYDTNTINSILTAWIILMTVVTAIRITAVTLFKLDKHAKQHTTFWKMIFIAGSLLGGISWGFAGLFIFPEVNTSQREIIILMLAGVSAGAVPLSAAIPQAVVTFLLTAIPPYIFAAFTINTRTYEFFIFALTLYLIFIITLSLKLHSIIKNSVILKHEKDMLLYNLREANKLLHDSATHDPLTKMANRSLFEEELLAAINDSSISRLEFALFFIDLDQFKLVNDIYGHEVGDELLIIVTDRVKMQIKQNDLMARLGGDELAIIVTDYSDKKELTNIANKICKSIREPMMINNRLLRISASIGISIYPHDGLDRETLLRVADKRMYKSKSSGGNRYTIADQSSEESVQV